MNKHVLIVEDEYKIAKLVEDYLTMAGYTTQIIDNGNDVMAAIDDKPPAAVLLDVMLPGMDGISLLKKIRQSSELPILMMTARVDEIDRILGLELGADDYICKPFSPRELVARLKTVLRRAIPNAPADSSDTFVLDETRYQCSFEQKSVELSAIEFQLLGRMHKEPGRIFSRQQLMNVMYNDQRVVNDRTIDSHIKKLRKKLAETFPTKTFIHSIYGVGYRFEMEDNSEN